MHTCVEVWSTSLRTSLQFGFLHFLSCSQTAGWRQHAAIAMAAQQVELRVENAGGSTCRFHKRAAVNELSAKRIIAFT